MDEKKEIKTKTIQASAITVTDSLSSVKLTRTAGGEIRPEVKVYDEWTIKVKKSPPNKVIEPEIVVNPNDYVERQDRVRIYFKGEEQTLRLLLVDALTDPDREVLAVTRDFDLDYAD